MDVNYPPPYNAPVSKQKESDVLNLGIVNARKYGFGSDGTNTR